MGLVQLWPSIRCSSIAAPPSRPVFSENQRYQNPGLARSYAYETVIMGTSHAENFLPSRVQTILDERAVKLAISGSTAHEQLLTLRLAIETGQVEHVVWILDYISFRKPTTAVGRKNERFPHHLYREGHGTLGRYLFSLDSFALSVNALAGRGHEDLDTLNAWYGDHEFGAARIMVDWHRRGMILDRINLDPTFAYGPTGDQTRESVSVNMLRLIEQHPGIRFDLVFPPYSILSYLADHRAWEHQFEERQAYKAFVVGATERLANARVFDFQGVRSITHDFDNYKDLEHFRLEISDYVLESIAQGRHRVHAASYGAEMAEQDRQVEAYRAEVCAARGPRRVLCPRIARPGHRLR